MEETQYIIIVAGGQGLRLNSPIPKQFLVLNGLPIIMHTMNVFYRYNPQCKQIIVLPKKNVKDWEALCLQYPIQIPYSFALGGETRFHSVKNGLDLIEEKEGWVGVHDAVRMLVSEKLIFEAYEHAKKHNAAIPCVKIKDSLRLVKKGFNEVVNRDDLVKIQTPQVFSLSLLKEAYLQPYELTFTDDASVVQKLGIQPFLFEGEETNIKITDSSDLWMAEAILNSRGFPPFPS